MITYNPAFDLYHCIFRMIHIIQRLDDNECLEVDKIRIWDFYILFPSKAYTIKIRRNEDLFKSWRCTYIKKIKNPYEYSGDNRKLFDRLCPYQMAALSSLVSYGIIDKSHFLNKEIKISNRVLLEKFIEKTGALSEIERNVLSFMSLFSKSMSMLGIDGLKSRTNLMESKYDAR